MHISVCEKKCIESVKKPSRFLLFKYEVEVECSLVSVLELFENFIRYFV